MWCTIFQHKPGYLLWLQFLSQPQGNIVFNNKLNLGVNIIFCRQDKTIQELCMSVSTRSIIFYNFCAHRPIYVDSQKWACIIGYITQFMINEKKALQLIFCYFCCSCCYFLTIHYTKDTNIKIFIEQMLILDVVSKDKEVKNFIGLSFL